MLRTTSPERKPAVAAGESGSTRVMRTCPVAISVSAPAESGPQHSTVQTKKNRTDTPATSKYNHHGTRRCCIGPALFRATNYTQSASELGRISIRHLHSTGYHTAKTMTHITTSFDTSRLLSQQKNIGKAYLEFLRVPALSAGLYVLGIGEEDKQRPHNEDEMYYVVRGRAQFRVVENGVARDQAVAAGTILYVPAHAEHRFHDISEDLGLLVLFAPAETSA